MHSVHTHKRTAIKRARLLCHNSNWSLVMYAGKELSGSYLKCKRDFTSTECAYIFLVLIKFNFSFFSSVRFMYKCIILRILSLSQRVWATGWGSYEYSETCTLGFCGNWKHEMQNKEVLIVTSDCAHECCRPKESKTGKRDEVKWKEIELGKLNKNQHI